MCLNCVQLRGMLSNKYIWFIIFKLPVLDEQFISNFTYLKSYLMFIHHLLNVRLDCKKKERENSYAYEKSIIETNF